MNHAIPAVMIALLLDLAAGAKAQRRRQKRRQRACNIFAGRPAFGAALLLTLFAVSAPLVADDLTGAPRLLCTAVQVTACYDDGECLIVPPWELNIPQFIEVDLEARTLATTAASGQNRSTPIKNLEREAGLIVLQGFEDGRAFSFLITEKTGMASIAVARDELGVTVFGACTPMPGKD